MKYRVKNTRSQSFPPSVLHGREGEVQGTRGGRTGSWSRDILSRNRHTVNCGKKNGVEKAETSSDEPNGIVVWYLTY